MRKPPGNETPDKTPLNPLKVAERHVHISSFPSFKMVPWRAGGDLSSIAVERIERHQKEEKGKTLIRVQAGSQISGMDHQAADAVGKPEGFLQVGWWKLHCK